MNFKDHYLGVSPAERVARQKNPGMVVRLTSLSGAGKTTLSVAVERRLFDGGYRTFILDGDSLRTGLCADLGFSDADRHENVRRAGVVSCLMADAGLICLTALISPFREDRLKVRRQLPAGCFLEVFVNAPGRSAKRGMSKGFIAGQEPNKSQILPASLQPMNHPSCRKWKCRPTV